MRIAFLLAPEGVEQIELTETWKAMTDAGHTPRLVSTRAGRIQAFDHLDKADTFQVDQTVDQASAEEYDALLLPGGVANPDALRLDDDAVWLVKTFSESGKLIAAICHAPWTLIEADVVRDRTVTSWPSLQTDLRNAGAHWVDEEAVTDIDGPNPVVTSRKPDDLKAFNETVLAQLGG